jgi:hypothetical protein
MSLTTIMASKSNQLKFTKTYWIHPTSFGCFEKLLAGKHWLTEKFDVSYDLDDNKTNPTQLPLNSIICFENPHLNLYLELMRTL